MRLSYSVRVVSPASPRSQWWVSDRFDQFRNEGFLVSTAAGGYTLRQRFRSVKQAQAVLPRIRDSGVGYVEILRERRDQTGRVRAEVCWTTNPSVVDQLAAVARRRSEGSPETGATTS